MFPTSSNILTTPITHYNNNIDIEVDTLRGRLAMKSINISREISAYSSVSSILGFLLSYSFLKEREVNIHNKAIIPCNISNLQNEDISSCNMNMCKPQGLKSSSILYEDKQLTEFSSWDGKALPLFLF